MGETAYVVHDSPVGPLLLTAADGALTRIVFPCGDRAHEPDEGWAADERPFLAVRHQLDGYFAARRYGFTVPIHPRGTPFQRDVWRALRQIPYGSTVSYAAVAAAVGRPKAVRAVGAANRANPLPIIVPCHRVIGSDGRLTGFGGGLPVKAFLLRLEAERVADASHGGQESLALAFS